jgi:hypothetical protein
MNQNTCENLTKIIRDLANMKPGLDLALSRFEPEDGLVIKRRINETKQSAESMINADRHGLDLDFYLSVLERIGSIEELEKRFVTVEIGGKSTEEIFDDLDYGFVLVYPPSVGAIRNFLGMDQDFDERRKKKQLVETVRLSTEELGLKIMHFKDLCEEAEKLGLALCPPEVAFPLRIADRVTQPDNTEYHIASKFVEVNGASYLFQIASITHTGLLSLGNFHEKTLFGLEEELVFRTNRKIKKKNKK